MPLVTERPRAPINKNKKEDGSFTLSAVRVFDVTPTGGDTTPLSYATAYAAVVSSGVDFDDPYDDDDFTDATVRGVTSAYNPVAGMWTFTASYGDPQGGDAFLATPPKVRYQPYTYTEIQDFDIDGVPFTNSAGVPFLGGMEVEKVGCIVTIRKPASHYDPTVMFTYGNAVNSTTLTLPDGVEIPAKCAKFLPPEIASTSTTADFQWVDLKFDVRPGPTAHGGWRKNVIDQGVEGWGTDADGNYLKGPIGTEGGSSPVSSDVRLDGTGVPIDPTTFSKIFDVNGKPYDIAGPESPAAASAVVSPTVGSGGLTTYSGSGTDGIVVLSFKRNKEIDLNTLLT